MADILKKITQLNKEKKPGDKSLLEELFPQVVKKESAPEEQGIVNLGTLGAPNLKMAPDGSISGFQEITIGSPTPPAAPPAEQGNPMGGMREFKLDDFSRAPSEAAPQAPAPEVPAGGLHELNLETIGTPAEISFGSIAQPPDPKAEERQRYIQLISALLQEGRYELAINTILEMRKAVGKPGGK